MIYLSGVLPQVSGHKIMLASTMHCIPLVIVQNLLLGFDINVLFSFALYLSHLQTNQKQNCFQWI